MIHDPSFESGMKCDHVVLDTLAVLLDAADHIHIVKHTFNADIISSS